MLDLLDYRRRMAELYRTVRHAEYPRVMCAWFRRQKDYLFRDHAQSPLDEDQKADFNGLAYFDYDPQRRVTAHLDPGVEPQVFQADLGKEGQFSYQRIGRVEITMAGGTGTLNVYWIMGYGGGLFLPFKDATSGGSTYDGGRYLIDTIKGADLGVTPEGELVLDFNYAYHPSCYYNYRWVCPLAPEENTLPFPVKAGERLLPDYVNSSAAF